jgi:hypothetical protein
MEPISPCRGRLAAAREAAKPASRAIGWPELSADAIWPTGKHPELGRLPFLEAVQHRCGHRSDGSGTPMRPR